MLHTHLHAALPCLLCAGTLPKVQSSQTSSLQGSGGGGSEPACTPPLSMADWLAELQHRAASRQASNATNSAGEGQSMPLRLTPALHQEQLSPITAQHPAPPATAVPPAALPLSELPVLYMGREAASALAEGQAEGHGRLLAVQPTTSAHCTLLAPLAPVSLYCLAAQLLQRLEQQPPVSPRGGLSLYSPLAQQLEGLLAREGRAFTLGSQALTPGQQAPMPGQQTLSLPLNQPSTPRTTPNSHTPNGTPNTTPNCGGGGGQGRAQGVRVSLGGSPQNNSPRSFMRRCAGWGGAGVGGHQHVMFGLHARV